METLNFSYDGGHRPDMKTTALVGVVGSGNLEIMVEPSDQPNRCDIEVVTAAVGFGDIWRAVMKDFFSRHHPGGVRISINDVGATPAVVSLRLDQAWENYVRGTP